MIGPGIANPMLWGGGDPLDELGVIERSLRIRSSVGGGLLRTPSASNRLKWTYSGWVKLSSIGQYATLFAATISAGVSEETIRFNASGQIEFNDGASGMLATTLASFRDTGAHGHLVAAYDSANPVAADRFILYWNNARLAITGGVGASRASYINAATLQGIGRPGSVIISSLDGYLSHVAFVDGKALLPSDFARTNSRTGQWRPKSKSAIRAAVAAGGGTRSGWGANGFFLPFDDSSSLAAIGYDRSQSDTDTAGNNWAATNISLTAGKTYDSLLDTPTNNFNTLNMLSRAASETIVAVDGGLTLTSSGTNYATLLSTMGMTKGKWYCEGVITTNTSIVNSRTGGGLATAKENLTTYLGSTNQGWGYYSIGSIFHNNGYNKTVPALAENDVFMIAFDADAGNLWFGKNGTWFLGGDPSTGANPMYSGLTDGPYFFAGWSYTTSDETVFNFGQRPFAHAVPTDFKSLCTKNLPIRQPVMRGDSAFVAVTDSGSSVAISLAAKAPWPNWIRIYKRRDGAEGWRWQFSDDQGNYLDSAGSAAKAAMPALSGTSYIGYALKLSAANGVASGRLTHVNGVADVVADGLATARKMVILKSEATGNWVVYHPELTAGKLLYLNTTGAEATDATISAVTATGFTASAALPSGTYRWIAFAETPGFLRLGKYVGNGSVDGPFNYAENSPALTITHVNIGGTSGWGVIDSTRDAGNPSGSSLALETTAAEVTGTNYLDQLANGFKLRQFTYNSNSTGQSQIFMAIAKSAFRYANAR